MSANKGFIPLCFCLLCLSFNGLGQQSFRLSQSIDSFYHSVYPQVLILKDYYFQSGADSLAREKFLGVLDLTTKPGILIDSFSFEPMEFSFSATPFLHLSNGYLSYNWNYRAGIDTPFVEKDISQHFLNGTANLVIAQTVPVRLTYFERQTNSSVFRNYRDVRLEFNAQEFQKLQAEKLRKYYTSLSSRFQNPFV